jgi:hypothetical protein
MTTRRRTSAPTTRRPAHPTGEQKRADRRSAGRAGLPDRRSSPAPNAPGTRARLLREGAIPAQRRFPSPGRRRRGIRGRRCDQAARAQQRCECKTMRRPRSATSPASRRARGRTRRDPRIPWKFRTSCPAPVLARPTPSGALPESSSKSNSMIKFLKLYIIQPARNKPAFPPGRSSAYIRRVLGAGGSRLRAGAKKTVSRECKYRQAGVGAPPCCMVLKASLSGPTSNSLSVGEMAGDAP